VTRPAGGDAASEAAFDVPLSLMAQDRRLRQRVEWLVALSPQPGLLRHVPLDETLERASEVNRALVAAIGFEAARRRSLLLHLHALLRETYGAARLSGAKAAAAAATGGGGGGGGAAADGGGADPSSLSLLVYDSDLGACGAGGGAPLGEPAALGRCLGSVEEVSGKCLGGAPLADPAVLDGFDAALSAALPKVRRSCEGGEVFLGTLGGTAEIKAFLAPLLGWPGVSLLGLARALAERRPERASLRPASRGEEAAGWWLVRLKKES